jgi:hypothetical protein
MVEGAHDLDLIDEALQAVLLSLDGLLGEGLDGVVLAVLIALYEVDGGKCSPSDFLDWVEDLVEASLVEVANEVVPPYPDVLRGLWVSQLKLL